MQCPRCHAENRDGLKFCEDCGSRLTLTCAQCGGELAPGKRFCGSCGAPAGGESAARTPSPESYTPKHLAEKILTSKASLEGERKQVTVLFADLKGSMELLADRDPEEARKLLDPVLERMMEAVHRYEGTVNQVMGDGIMALFGAPLAHEDHAVRACYAALRMQEAVKRYGDDVRRTEGVSVRIRIGLNSGEVVVRAIGSDLHMDYTAVGQTTNLAARMEQLADPGTALVAPATLALAEDFVSVRSLGPTPVKGVREPVHVYELTDANPTRSRFHAHAARGLTKFVGRSSELAQLAEALDLARGGRGQVVAVAGEAGVGKSRLFWEFAHSHRTDGCLVLEAASVSYGRATTYLPVIDLLRGYFQVEPRDDLRKIREKVTGKLFSLDRALEPTLPALFALLDVPVEDEEWTRVDPPQRRHRTLDAVKRLLLRESHVQPLVVIFEDLHWIDGETQAVLDGLVESLPTARMLLLVNYRPEYQPPWSRKSHYRQVRIDVLPSASAEELLRALLGRDPSLAPLERLLIERTEGNPFFLEESVRTLVETRVLEGAPGAYRLTRAPAGLRIPATAQAILAARIDRLPLEEKGLLQTCAVIGKDVPFALIQALADRPEHELQRDLTHLQTAEFLYETRLFPELEYTFKHALTHEVAYGSLLRERRRALHARIVEALETLHRDRLGEHIERLAHHALRGELREQAVHYLRQAGLKATAQSAHADARVWLEQALAVLEALPENRSTLEQGFEIRLELRPVLNLLGESRRQLACLRAAEGLAERLNDDARRSRVCAFMTNVHVMLGELDEAFVTGTRALEIAGNLGDLELRILSTSYLEQVHYHRGEYERVVELATGNLAALPTDWVYKYLGRPAPPSIFDRFQLILSLAELGRFDKATERAVEAIRLTEPMRQQHWNSVALAYYAEGALHLLEGDWAKAGSPIEHAIQALRAGSIVVMLPYTVAALSRVLAQAGETSGALIQLQEAELLLERQTASGTFGHRGSAYHSLGCASLLLGRLDDARRFADYAIESSPQQPGCAAYALHLMGDIATHPDRFNPERGEAHYRQALALAEPRGMRPLIAHCHLGLGKLYRRTDRQTEAQEHLTTAMRLYREMDMGFWLQKADAELGGVER